MIDARPFKKRIKVLHIITNLNLGGAETNLYNLLTYLDKDSVEIHVAYSFGGPYEDSFKKNKEIVFFKYSKHSHKIVSFSSMKIILKLMYYILVNKIQLVHTHNLNAHVWGALAAKFTGVQVVEHVHDYRYENQEFLHGRQEKIGKYKYLKYLGKLSDIIVVLTKKNNRFLIEQKICKESQIKVILNGINLNNGQDIDKGRIFAKLNLPVNKKIILAASRLIKQKNVGLILEIAKRIKTAYPEVFFVIAGDGDLRTKLEEKTVSDGIDQLIKFIGFYPNVLELLSITDIFIQPSLLELHSIAMLEAMSMKVPVLVSKGVGANDDFIKNGETGFLLDPFKVDEWVFAIEKLIHDSELAKKIGGAGRVLVEQKCDIRKTAKEFENIYRNLRHK